MLNGALYLSGARRTQRIAIAAPHHDPFLGTIDAKDDTNGGKDLPRRGRSSASL